MLKQFPIIVITISWTVLSWHFAGFASIYYKTKMLF